MTTNQIKKELARKTGLNTSQIRIKTTGNYETAYNIKLLSMSYDINKLERIAREMLESIDRDERTGEILAGGNYYVFVEYDRAAIDAAYNANNKILEKFEEKAKTTPAGCLTELFNNLFIMKKSDGELAIHDEENRKTRYISPSYLGVTLLNMGKWDQVTQLILN